MLKRRIISLGVSMAVLCSSFGGAVATQNQPSEIRLRLDGKMMEFPDVKPFLDQKNRVQVPIRFVSESLGAAVDWNQDERSVTIKKGNDTIILYVEKNIAYQNNKEIYLDTFPIIKDDRTVVPVRFVSEKLGQRVHWFQKDRIVEIATSPKHDSTVPADFKQFVNMYPNNSDATDLGFQYSNEGKPNIENLDLFASKDDARNLELFLTVENFEPKTIEAVKGIFKIYFSKDYQKVCGAFQKVVNMEVKKVNMKYVSSIKDACFDNRYFTAIKFENGMSIFITKKGLKRK